MRDTKGPPPFSPLDRAVCWFCLALPLLVGLGLPCISPTPLSHGVYISVALGFGIVGSFRMCRFSTSSVEMSISWIARALWTILYILLVANTLRTLLRG